MRRKTNNSKCIKTKSKKCKEVIRTYNNLQQKYADKLEGDNDVIEIQVNIELKGIILDGDYTTDFLCKRYDGRLFVRECIYKRLLTRPSTAKLLDASRIYWLSKGISDWGIVIDADTEK